MASPLDLQHSIREAHGALFTVRDGICVAGPCVGERLEAVPARIVDGEVLVPPDAGL